MEKPADQMTATIEQSSANAQGVIPQDAETTLESIVPMMQHIAHWLIHSGIGYTDFVAALKPVFYEQALAELGRIKQNKTDSAVSLLSGLHRKDVSAFRQQATQLTETAKVTYAISVPARVIARWIALELPHQIPVSGEENSFEALVRHISTENTPVQSCLNCSVWAWCNRSDRMWCCNRIALHQTTRCRKARLCSPQT